MDTLAVEVAGRAKSVEFTENELVVRLADGRTLLVPLTWFPKLLQATSEERQGWKLVGDGDRIHWPALHEDLGVRGLLRGTPAPSFYRPPAR
ncbi:MAG TPA: DUF2442 domain-containing protein [Thermoanaerobaculia bacterium]|nr:DUF2442 domain-containing protein [Thermoanaerobaculia bacterium]